MFTGIANQNGPRTQTQMYVTPIQYPLIVLNAHKVPGGSVIFSFPPVDDLFGKMAVSRHQWRSVVVERPGT